MIRNLNPWKQVPDHHSVFLRLKKLPYDCRLAHIFDPFLDQNHRLYFMVQKAQYLDQCPVKSCFLCLLCLFLLSQNLDARHYCYLHRFLVVSFLSVTERSIESNEFYIIKTLRENYASRFWTSMLRYWMPCNQNIFWSEFFICYSQKMMSKTCARWVVSTFTEVKYLSFFPQSVRGAIINSPLCYKQSRPHLFFSFCLSAQYTWAGRVHMIWCWKGFMKSITVKNEN